jgi:hypothetical protein
MIVKYKNEGKYIPYELNGTVLSFGNGELEIDLAARQCGYMYRIAVSLEADGGLEEGQTHRYVAEIDIPARVYKLNYKGCTDDLGIVQAYRTTEPFDESKVVLTLWALDES